MAVELAAAPASPGPRREREKRARLARQPLLSGCSPLTLRRIAAVADEITAQPGEVLVWQGRHVFWFFLIQEGRADVVRDGRVVDQLAAGQYFGEIILERRRTQPTSIVATTPMRLFVIAGQRFVPLANDLRPLRTRLGVTGPQRRHRPPRLHRRPRPPAPPLPRRLPVAPPRRRRRRGQAYAAVGLLLALAAGSLYHPPAAVIAPGPAFDVAHDIVISGVPTTAVRGRFLLTSVDVTRPRALGLATSMFSPDREVVGAGRVTPAHSTGVSARRRQVARFRESRILGAVAAARALGLPVTTDPDGTPRLPFDIQFRARDVAGPSAGLAYALAILDALSPADVARGRVIAASGEIDAAGNVGLVSFLDGKAAAARRAGARVFVVPGAQTYAAGGHGMRVTGVSTLDEAVATLTAR